MTLCRSFPYRTAILLLLLAGCATQNTLAQDIATDAWNKCRTPNVALTRIEPDGRLWFYTYNGSIGQQEFQECYRKYYADRAANTRTAAPPAMVANPPAASTQAISAPIWKPGDEWEYRWESPRGKGTFVWSVDRLEAVGGMEYYVVKSGQRELFYRASDLAWFMDKVNGTIESQARPPDIRYLWPLEIGKRWDSAYTLTRPGDRTINERLRECETVASEIVSVPAGTFETVKISCRDKRSGAITHEAWYAPAVRQFVRWRGHWSYGVEERELIGGKAR